MIEIHVYQVALPFRKPISISRIVRSSQTALVVEIRESGVSGWGEASEFPVYHAEIPGMLSALHQVTAKMNGSPVQHPLDFFSQVSDLVTDQPFALAALDMAMYDLWGRLHQCSTRKILGLPPYRPIPTAASVTIAGTAEMISDFQGLKDFANLKLKVGQDSDLEILQLIQSHGPRRILADANGNMTFKQAEKAVKQFPEFGVFALEQPLSRNSSEQRRLKKISPIPLIADESFTGPQTLDECCEGFDGVNLKLMKVGGITPAIRLIEKLRTRNLRVHMGCMPESMISIAALSQIACLADFVDADSAMLFDSLPMSGLSYREGCVQISDTIGHGVTFKPQQGDQKW